MEDFLFYLLERLSFPFSGATADAGIDAGENIGAVGQRRAARDVEHADPPLVSSLPSRQQPVNQSVSCGGEADEAFEKGKNNALDIQSLFENPRPSHEIALSRLHFMKPSKNIQRLLRV